ncbi:MAG: DUF72 domain-containing protein [Acidimicrobiia bacterium]|nr:DUF72 domain-containing protein [Acidimicrobiia bacterium]
MSTPFQMGLFEAPAPPFRARLAAKLRALAGQGIYVGASSWKYEGWMGQVYTAERYQQRGRFSRRRFQQECLGEYAETFPVVCGDFSFYQFPAPEYWNKLFASAPPKLKFAFKAPEEITVKIFPIHPRYGGRAGEVNPSFLDADLFRRMFLEPLEAYGDRVAALIFEFGAFSPSCYKRGEQFVEDLDGFLGALPKGRRYSVEIRNAEFVGPDYVGCLRQHGVAHVFNAWTRMPELGAQIAYPGIHTTDFTLTRALLRAGRPYAMAVKKFQPYQAVQEENPGARDALREIIRRAQQRSEGAFVFVNNRLEGNAPGTIAAIVDGE